VRCSIAIKFYRPRLNFTRLDLPVRQLRELIAGCKNIIESQRFSSLLRDVSIFRSVGSRYFLVQIASLIRRLADIIIIIANYRSLHNNEFNQIAIERENEPLTVIVHAQCIRSQTTKTSLTDIDFSVVHRAIPEIDTRYDTETYLAIITSLDVFLRWDRGRRLQIANIDTRFARLRTWCIALLVR